MKTLAVVIYMLQLLSVWSKFIATPSNGVYSRGNNVTLTCKVEGNNLVIWERSGDIAEIYVGKEKISQNKEYENFQISPYNDDFSLFIINADVTDSGIYLCKDRDNVSKAMITITVRPTLRLGINVSKPLIEEPLRESVNTNVLITCSAIGAIPTVETIRLQINEGNWSYPARVDTKRHDLMYDTSVTLNYTLSSGKFTVTCGVFGHNDTLALNLTDAFYIPKCKMTRSTLRLSCTCKSKPPTYRKVFAVNGEPIQEMTNLSIDKYAPAMFTCYGTNAIGTTKSTSEYIENTPGSNVSAGYKILIAIIATVIAICIIIVIYVIVYRQKNRINSDSTSGVQEPLLNETDINRIVQDYTNIIMNKQEIIQNVEYFYIQILDMDVNFIKDVIFKTRKPQEQVKQVLEKWCECFTGKLSKTKLLEQLKKKLDEFVTDAECQPAAGHTTCHEPVDDNLIDGAEKETTFSSSNSSFSATMNDCGSCIGGMGTEKLLSTHYAKFQSNFDNAVNDTLESGVRLIYILMQKNEVTDELLSLKTFVDKLENVYLFRASKIIHSFIDKVEIREMISRISSVLVNDVEIFADEVLKLQDPKQIADGCSSAKEYIDAAVLEYMDAEKGNVTQKSITELIKISDFAADIFPVGKTNIKKKKGTYRPKSFAKLVSAAHVEEPSNQTSNLPTKDFANMLNEIAVLIGKRGARKLLQQYQGVQTDLMVDDIKCPGYEVLAKLIKNGCIINNKKSIENLETNLDKAMLFLAGQVVLGNIDVGEMLETENQGCLENTNASSEKKDSENETTRSNSGTISGNTSTSISTKPTADKKDKKFH